MKPLIFANKMLIMTIIMREAEYQALRDLARSRREHCGYLVCTAEPQDSPFAGHVLVVGVYPTGEGDIGKVIDDPHRLRRLDNFLEQNRRNGFEILQWHTHAVEAPPSPFDITTFHKLDDVLGDMPHYVVTPGQFYSAGRAGGSYRIDHPEDLPLLIPEDDAATVTIRRIKQLVSLELEIL